MSKTDLTKLLTKIGYLHLKNKGCFAISTEVKVYVWGQRDWSNKQDRHWAIDLFGIRHKYLPITKQYTNDEGYKVNKIPILDGIEIKTSRADFKKGFIHTGCHYNYLLTPQGLVKKNEVHKDIGIIEVDLKNFQLKKYSPPYSGFDLRGVKYIRTAKGRELTSDQINYAWGQLEKTLTNQASRWLIADILRVSEEKGDNEE